MVESTPPVYDPAKRREYYLRTRQLKGRQPGSSKPIPSQRAPVLKPPSKPKAKSKAEIQLERRKHLQAQVDALKLRLEKLRKILQEEVKKAQARSGVKTTPVKKPSPSKADHTKTQKLTAQQKAKKAEAEKKYREQHPDKFLADQVSTLTKKIKLIQQQIAKMRKENSVGIRRGATKKGDSQNGS